MRKQTTHGGAGILSVGSEGGEQSLWCAVVACAFEDALQPIPLAVAEESENRRSRRLGLVRNIEDGLDFFLSDRVFKITDMLGVDRCLVDELVGMVRRGEGEW